MSMSTRQAGQHLFLHRRVSGFVMKIYRCYGSHGQAQKKFLQKVLERQIHANPVSFLLFLNVSISLRILLQGETVEFGSSFRHLSVVHRNSDLARRMKLGSSQRNCKMRKRKEIGKFMKFQDIFRSLNNVT